MQIPNIPTDNLYKFKALSGIILIITALFAFIYLEKDKYENLIDIAKYRDLSAIDSMKVNDSIVYFQKLYLVKKREFKQKFNFHHDSLYIENPKINSNMIRDLNDLWKIELKIKNLRNKIDFRDLDLRIQNKIEDIKGVLYKVLYALLIFISGFGIYLSISGFYKWYERTQKRYDKKLIKESLIESQFIEKNEALRKIYDIYYNMLPEKRHKDEEWDDALTHISSNFTNIKKNLEDFREKYSYLLSQKSQDKLDESIVICSESSSYNESERNEAANNLFNNIQNLIDNIKQILKREIN